MFNYFIVFLIIIIIQIIILGIIFSNLELNIEECDISYNIEVPKKLQVKKLKVNVKIYLFKKINILKIKIYRNYCEIFKIKVHLNILKELKDDKQQGTWFVLKNIGKLKPQIKKINFEISGGTEDVLLTTFLVPIFSGIVFTFISKNLDEKNNERISNCNIKILPRYINANNFSISGTTKIHFDTMRTLFFIKKHKKIKI